MSYSSASNNSSALPRLASPLSWLGACLAIVGVGLALQPERAFSGLLTAGLWGLQITLGALIYIALFTVSRALWWRPARGLFAELGSLLPVPLAVALVAVVGGSFGALYPWSVPGALDKSHLLHAKAGWFDQGFFLARAGVVALVWLGFMKLLVGRVRAYADRPSKATKGRLVRSSAAFIVLFALTISVAFWDWSMSLEPEWFSTMYGVYGFAGAMQAGIAATTALAIYASERRGAKGIERIDDKTLHDFGKLVFGFSFFWAYIWFCQYMLIWYANLPEEVTHYITRTHGSWGFLFWFNVLVNFAIPFLVLLPVSTKKQKSVMMHVCLLVLAGRFLDLYLLVEPSISPHHVPPPVYHLAAAATVVFGGLAWAHRKRQPVQSPAPVAAE